MTRKFYDQLAPYYHLLYPNWEASIARQGRGLATVLEEFRVTSGRSLLDAACGIGTQTLGLAALGYAVTASDVAPAAVARARTEAQARELSVTFAVTDLRHLAFAGLFAAVLACDNAIPHLLSDDDIRAAFVECRRVLAPSGVLLISVRDYATIVRRSPDHHVYGTHRIDDREYSAEQIWRWDHDQYDLTLRLTEKRDGGIPIVREFLSRYYAVTI